MRYIIIKWNEDLAYSIGLIVTDGCLSIDGRHITLVSKDIEQLTNFAKCLKLTSKISKHTGFSSINKHYYHISFSGVALYRFLIGIGLTPHKSKSINRLKVPDTYFKDFLRGSLDGDGNISTWINKANRSEQWYLRIFSGSLPFLKWLNNEVTRLYKSYGKISISIGRKGEQYFTLKFGKVAANKVIRYILHPVCISLTRKRKLAMLCLQSAPKMIN